eukprot:11999067-Alexandrium_andersonii.AAC.1
MALRLQAVSLRVDPGDDALPGARVERLALLAETGSRTRRSRKAPLIPHGATSSTNGAAARTRAPPTAPAART